MEWLRIALLRLSKLSPQKNLTRVTIFAILCNCCSLSILAQDIPENLKFANGLYQQRRYDLAAEEFQKYLAANAKSTSDDVANATYALATCRLFLGQYAEARKAFDEFLAKAPKHPNVASAQFRVGETSYLMGDMQRAGEALKLFLDEAPAEHPQRDSALVYAGDVALRQEKPDAAIGFYQKAIEAFPTGRLTTRAVFGLGRSLAQKGQHKEALEQFQKLQKTGGQEWNERAWYQIVLENLELKQTAAATQALAELKMANPRGQLLADATWRLAEAVIAAGKPDDARTWLEELARADPPTALSVQAASRLAGLLLDAKRGADALALLGPVLARIEGQPQAATLLYQSAEALLQTGDKAKSAERFTQLADKYPQDTWADDARLRAADLAVEARQFEQARKQLDQLFIDQAKSPLADDARLLQARVESSSGNHRKAAELLEPLVKTAARDDLKASASYQLALAYQALGQADKAQALLAAMSGPAMPAGSAEALLLLGQSSFESKKYASAADALGKYLKTGNTRLADHALSWLAISQWEAGQRAEAGETVKRLQKEFAKSPTLVPLLLRLGESALEAKQADTAAGWLEAVAQLAADKPTQARAFTDLGYTYTELKRPADAAKAFASAAERAEGDTATGREASLAAARVMASSGKFDDALGQLDRLLADPKSAGTPAAREARLNKARILNKAGRPADAAAAYGTFAESYLETGKENKENDRDQVLSEWAYALMDAGKQAEADHVFGRLLAEAPKSKFTAEARLNLAESAFAAKKYKEVTELLAELVQKSKPADLPDTLREPALYRAARAWMELKTWDQAQSIFGQVRVDYPKTELGQESIFWLAEIAARTDKPEEALKLLDELQKVIDPAKPPAWVATAQLRRVQALTALKRWDDIVKSVDETLSRPMHPNSQELTGELNYARGRALQATARFDDARKAFQAAIDARPSADVSAKAQFMRGETYFHEKNYREALREFLKVDILHDAPVWQAAALLEAGKVYEQLNQQSDAADLYERVLERFPREAAAPEAKNRLGAVRAMSTTSANKPAA